MPGRGEDLFQQVRRGARGAHEHGDLLGRHSLLQQRGDLGCDELELGAFAAALQQAQRGPGVHACGFRLEQGALEVAQGGARVGRVVFGARRQLTVLGREGGQRVEARGAPGERRPPLLVGQRHRHLGPDHPPERLDRVQLQTREVVEAVEQHRCPAPQRRTLAQDVQGTHRALLGIQAADSPQRGEVLGKDGSQRSTRDPGTVRRKPGRQGAAEPGRGHPPDLQLGEQVSQRAHESWGRRHRARRRCELLEHALARQPAEHGLADPGAPDGLPDQPRKALHAHSHRRSSCGKLAQVVLDVGPCRNDQQRLLAVREMPRARLHDDLGLARVGGPCDERDRHARPSWRTRPTRSGRREASC